MLSPIINASCQVARRSELCLFCRTVLYAVNTLYIVRTSRVSVYGVKWPIFMNQNAYNPSCRLYSQIKIFIVLNLIYRTDFTVWFLPFPFDFLLCFCGCKSTKSIKLGNSGLEKVSWRVGWSFSGNRAGLDTVFVVLIFKKMSIVRVFFWTWSFNRFFWNIRLIDFFKNIRFIYFSQIFD